MKTFFSITTVIALATAASASAIKNNPLRRQTDCPAADAPVCETSDGSPMADDCMFYVPYPDNYAGGCAQPHGSGCQTDSEYLSCEVAFCQDGESDSSVMCFDEGQTSCIGEYITSLVDTCRNGDGKVGGYVHVPMGDNYINVVLAHT